MKPAVGTIVLLLAALAGLGGNNQRRLAVLRVEHESLLAEASARGISLESPHPAKTTRFTEKPMEVRFAVAEDTIAWLLAAYRELDAGADPRPKRGQKVRQPPIELTQRLLSLEGERLTLFIEALRTPGDLLTWRRDTLLKFAVGRLAEDRPQDALTILTEFPEVREVTMKHVGSTENPVYLAVDRWATTDFPAALAWFRNTRDKFPAFEEPALCSLVCRAAESDPQLALSLISEFEIDSRQLVYPVIRGVKTQAQRAAMLTVVRQQRATVGHYITRGDTLDTGIKNLVFGENHTHGFEASTQLIDSSEWTHHELDLITRDLKDHVRPAETGRWIDWLGKNLPAEQAPELTWPLIPKWTRHDYQAAGKWLATAPDGPARNHAIQDFAQVVFIDDPEAAIQWTLRLPEGPERQETLQSFYDNWPKSDPASREAAEAFARERGFP